MRRHLSKDSNVVKRATARLASEKRRVLTNVDNIGVYLHRTRVSGKYNYSHLKWIIENHSFLSLQRSFYNRDTKRMGYNRVVLWRLGDLNITGFFDPKERYKPWSVMEFSYPSKDHLYALDKLMPGLTVSQAEYACDLFCKGQDVPDKVEDLMWTIGRYLYVPYKKEAKLCNDFIEWGEDRPENAFYSMPNFLTYERGPDSKKHVKGGGKVSWDRKDVDRVRMELTAVGHNLRGKGVRKLEDFKKGPGFGSMLDRKFDFRVFKSGRDLPREYDDYSTRDENGNSNSLQQEFLAAKKRGVSNPSQYFKKDEILGKMHGRIMGCARKVDERWAL